METLIIHTQDLIIAQKLTRSLKGDLEKRKNHFRIHTRSVAARAGARVAVAPYLRHRVNATIREMCIGTANAVARSRSVAARAGARVAVFNRI